MDFSDVFRVLNYCFCGIQKLFFSIDEEEEEEEGDNDYCVLLSVVYFSIIFCVWFLRLLNVIYESEYFMKEEVVRRGLWGYFFFFEVDPGKCRIE